MPHWPVGPGFMVADAAIDKDCVMTRLDNIALHTKIDILTRRIEEKWLQPVPVFFQDFRGQVREEITYLQKRSLLFDDLLNNKITKVDRRA